MSDQIKCVRCGELHEKQKNPGRSGTYRTCIKCRNRKPQIRKTKLAMITIFLTTNNKTCC